ncbi:ATP-binding cassette domain-containing protein [Arthrobacter sp. HMSC08H08]|uniref:ABC transporter ATP-binding protein/permease n=1 Tax=Arthrobacter sp. HMSC08H08 TaxID=1581143 RepID=UPI0008A2A929|nr:ABC transporter ATP-binding protein/permease [Arthrobacter sp. HMSC08H08]OFT24146.1 hypothetical protein HMPREF3175_02505 [Arthrobacter sp. HMSC08H08]
MERQRLIQMRGVTRQYGPDSTAGIFDVDLDIDAGEYVAIVGPSGAGKSTLLQILGLLDAPNEGSYTFAGKDLTSATEKDRDQLRAESIGFVFQASHVLPHLDALSNAALGMVPHAVPLQERSEIAYEAMNSLGIADRATYKAGVLSGGERQRLAVARALAPQPELVLADEPTGALDTASGMAVLADLERAREHGATLIVITHDEDVAARAHRVIRIVDGRIAEDTGAAESTPAAANESVAKPRKGPLRTRVADVLAESLTEVLLRGIRTAFLVLAFALGIGGLIASVGISQTAAVQINERLEAAAFDEVWISTPDYAREELEKNLAQDQHRLRQLPHVQRVTRMIQLPTESTGLYRMEPGDVNVSGGLQIIAVDDQFFETQDLTLGKEHTADLFGMPAVTSVAVVGLDAHEALQLPGSEAGGTVVVGGHRLTVVDSFTTGERRPGLNNAVLVPLSLAPQLHLGQPQLVMRTDKGFPAALAEAVPMQLNAADPGSYRVQTVADLRNLRMGVSTDLDALVGIMAATLLILAAVSASTSMYLTVLSRAPEIALRRALGTTRKGIAARFVTEGVMIGFIGGAVGALAGVLGVVAVSAAQGWKPQVEPWLVPVGLGLGVVAGLVSSVVPAFIASKQPPSNAL